MEYKLNSLQVVRQGLAASVYDLSSWEVIPGDHTSKRRQGNIVIPDRQQQQYAFTGISTYIHKGQFLHM